MSVFKDNILRILNHKISVTKGTDKNFMYDSGKTELYVLGRNK